MRLADIDTSATLGVSALNRADPVPKIVAFALVLTSVVVSTNILVVTAIALVLLAAVVGMRLHVRSLLALAAYPALFALLFAWAAAPDPLSGSLVVAKAFTAALSALTLMYTTPYPQVFAPIQRVVPGVVGDALLLTYRSFFLLLRQFSELARAARLRAGVVRGHPVRSARAMTRALGGLVLYSFDLSQRTYDVMRVRGYGRALRAHVPHGQAPLLDAAVLGGALAITVTALAWRFAWRALGPYSWVPPLAGLVLLLAGAIAAIATGPRTTVRPLSDGGPR
jgi:energy-coupling factor transporter transmembrane protein EcfT